MSTASALLAVRCQLVLSGSLPACAVIARFRRCNCNQVQRKLAPDSSVMSWAKDLTERFGGSAHWHAPHTWLVFREHGRALPLMSLRCCSLPAHDVGRLFTASACPSVAECCQLMKLMTVHCQYACCSLPAWNHMFSGFSSCVRCHMVRATTVHCQCASLLFAASLVLMETVTAVLAVRCRANAHAVHCQRVFMFALLCTASAQSASFICPRWLPLSQLCAASAGSSALQRCMARAQKKRKDMNMVGRESAASAPTWSVLVLHRKTSTIHGRGSGSSSLFTTLRPDRGGTRAQSA